jgi:hypothetical protein
LTKIAVGQIKDRLKEELINIDVSDAVAFNAAFVNFLQWCASSRDKFDDDGQKLFEEILGYLKTEFRKKIAEMPDTPQKRTLARKIGIADGQHLAAESLVATLAKTSVLGSLIEPAVTEFKSILQNIVDVLFDVSKKGLNFARVAMVGLSYWAVDELLAANHLAQHAFVNQAYNHIRTVWEILDKLNLFHQQPEWAELWAKGSDREVLRELNPSAVRQKLGKKKHDPWYSLFSEIGPHATYRGFQARSQNETPRSGQPRFQHRIWVAGTGIDSKIIAVNTMCAFAAMKLLLTLSHVFSADLHPDEIKEVIENAIKHFQFFWTDYFAECGQKDGWPVDELLQSLGTTSKR